MNTLTEAKTPVALYDMSIEDVKERAAKKQEFPSILAAANFLGMRQNQLSDRIGLKKYARHRETKKKYAVRKIKIQS